MIKIVSVGDRRSREVIDGFRDYVSVKEYIDSYTVLDIVMNYYPLCIYEFASLIGQNFNFRETFPFRKRINKRDN